MSAMQLNQKGSILIIILILSGVLILSGFIVMSLISGAEKATLARRKEELLFEIVRSQTLRMNDSIDCTNMLKNNVFKIGTPAVEQNIIISSSFGADANIPLNYIKAGKIFNGEVKLSKVTIHAISAPGIAIPIDNDKRFAYSAAVVAPKSAAATTKFLAEIKFYTSSFPWNQNLEEKKIKLYIKVRNSTNKIWECHGADSPAEACEVVIQGTYNPYMPPGMEAFRCNPDRNCFAAQGPVNGLFTTPTCPMPTLYKPQYIGKMAAVNYYICNWCNPYR